MAFAQRPLGHPPRTRGTRHLTATPKRFGALPVRNAPKHPIAKLLQSGICKHSSKQIHYESEAL